MFEYNGIIYRNLMEQVKQNKIDIADLIARYNTVEGQGFLIVGVAETVADLPDPDTYDGNYGDCYIVGTEDPFSFYIYVKGVEDGVIQNRWINLGDIAVPGQQGPQGVQGPAGPTGESSLWYVTDSTVPSTADAQEGDMCLSLAADPSYFGMVYRYDGSEWQSYTSIAGPQGLQGPQGPAGATGAQGPAGPTGADGKDGAIWYTSTASTPDVATPHEGDMFVSMNPDPLYLGVVWRFNGTAWLSYESIVGPQGLAGATGEQGPAGATGAQGPTGQDGKNGSMWYVGTASVPASGTYYEHDMYLNTSDGVVKTFLTEGVSPDWYEYGSIMGPAGPTGAQGPAGPQGPFTNPTLFGNNAFLLNNPNSNLSITKTGQYNFYNNTILANINNTTTSINLTDMNDDLTNNIFFFPSAFNQNSSSFNVKMPKRSWDSICIFSRDNTVARPFYIKRSIINLDYKNPSISASPAEVDCSILYCTGPNGSNWGTKGPTIQYSLIVGESEHINYDTLYSEPSTKKLKDSALIGLGLKISVFSPSNSTVEGVLMCGKYGILNNTNDRLVVGAGTASGSEANCFTTGNDGTDDYIKIGETKLTETQLQALLATL